MDYRELKEKKIYLVIPVSDSADSEDEAVAKAYVIANTAAEAVAKVKLVDKSILAGDSVGISLEADLKDLEESIKNSSEQTVKVKVDDKEEEVKVYDGDAQFKHEYEAGKIYAKTMTDGSIILFLANTVDDVIKHLADPNIASVAVWDEKAYLINHVDLDTKAPNTEGETKPSEGGSETEDPKENPEP